MAAAPGVFPEVDLDAFAIAPTYHKVVFTINSKQDGSPWVDQTTTYYHMSKANVTLFTGEVVKLGGKFGPRNKPQNADCDLSMKIEVDGQLITTPLPEWKGISKLALLEAERALLMMWLGMNEDSMKVNKAHGKI